MKREKVAVFLIFCSCIFFLACMYKNRELEKDLEQTVLSSRNEKTFPQEIELVASKTAVHILSSYMSEVTNIEQGHLLMTEPVYDQVPSDEDTKRADRTIDINQPMVALTFDDGPHIDYTNQILDYLEEKQQVATFFILGQRVKGNEETLNRMLTLGCDIGNHTYDHKDLTKLSVSKMLDEINKTQEIVEDCTGYTMHLLRPTYGAMNDTLISNVTMPLILWSVDTMDWKSKQEDKIVKEAIKNVKDGQIILMHDIYPETVKAVKRVIDELLEQGYQLVTITELLTSEETKLVDGKKYYMK